MSGSFDNLPRLQSLDEGEYGKISAGLRPPHSIFTKAVDREFPLSQIQIPSGQTRIQGRSIRIQFQQLFATRFQIKLHLQKWARATARTAAIQASVAANARASIRMKRLPAFSIMVANFSNSGARGVKSAGLAPGRPLPLYANQRTLSDRASWSVWCQFQTDALKRQ